MISHIRRSVLLASGVVALALASSPAFAATSSGFDTVGSTIMPFAINGGNEVMNLQADGIHFDPGAKIYGISSIGIQTSNIFRALTVGGGEIALVKQSSGWSFLNISDGNANGGGNLQIRGLANGGTAGVNLGQLDLMANSVTVEGALSANGGGGNGVYGNTSSGSAWGGVFTGPVYGVYAYGSAWAGYFDGPVNIARGGLHFPDGSVQTTAAVGGAVSSPTGGGNWSQTDLGWHSFCALSFMSSSGRLGGSVRVWTDQQSGNKYHWLLTTQGGGSQWIEHTAANCLN
jgi:hypothetical protein